MRDYEKLEKFYIIFNEISFTLLLEIESELQAQR